MLFTYIYFTEIIDFDCANIAVKFVPNTRTANFAIQITKDRLFEETEAFTIQLTNTISSEQLNIKLSDPSIAVGQIINEGMNKRYL